MNLYNIIRVIRCLKQDYDNPYCVTGDGQQYLLYHVFAIASCAIMVLSKISEDLFIQLNRDRSIVRISIFQYDLLKNVNRKDIWRITMLASSDPAEELIESLQLIENRSIETPLGRNSSNLMRMASFDNYVSQFRMSEAKHHGSINMGINNN